ncbi:MAG: putative DNA binding domain-containing protein [Oscillospiraceae bacterium]|jgi:ATP-dependent DNA helicase RecG|nr:putative DNA binding domain-containing protein [Oscillospiraceae bacterium]
MKKYETIEKLLNAPEGDHFEFKKAENRYDIDEGAKYLSALSNCGGGRLVLGVTDKRPRKVVGSKACPQPESTVRYFMDKLHVRVNFEIYHDEKDNRVLVFQVAGRPVGLPVQFEGIAWWRDGDSLIPMPEDVRRKIYAEGGYDFSGEICKGLTLDDLDNIAIENFRDRWQKYRNNKRIAALSVEQLLRDADAITDDGVTYAALILFGRRASLLKYLPTAEVVFEYRSSEASGPAGQRIDFREGFFNYYDKVWELVNNRNEDQHYQERFAVLPVPTFNERVVRESLLNSVSHRNYQQRGSIFVRQYTRKLIVESPGGFPLGITAENILDRHEARNERIAAIFQLCGLVERSGQGMNLIYEQAIREAKPLPKFDGSDDYRVKLTLDLKVIHPRMLALIKQIDEEKLNVMSTDDYLLLGSIFREEDLRGVPLDRFEHLIELEIVKFSKQGVEPANGGIILTIGTQSEPNFDEIPIQDSDKDEFIGSLSEAASDKIPINTLDKQKIVLEYMAKVDYITTAMIAEQLNISQRAALNILKKLIEKGFVSKSGSNRNAKYSFFDVDEVGSDKF